MVDSIRTPTGYYDPAAGRQSFVDPTGGPPTRRLPFTAPSQDAGEYEHLMGGGVAPSDDEIHSIIQEGTQADDAGLAGLSQEWAADDGHEEWEEALAMNSGRRRWTT